MLSSVSQPHGNYRQPWIVRNIVQFQQQKEIYCRIIYSEGFFWMYCHVILTRDVVWICNFIYLTFTSVTTNNYGSHWVSPEITATTAHIKSPRSSSRCLVAASNGGRSPTSGFPNCPWLQLLVSHCSQTELSTDSTCLPANKLPLVLASTVFLGSEFHGNHDYIFYSVTALGVCGTVHSDATMEYVTIQRNQLEHRWERCFLCGLRR
jgi:hypothetical protein